jgi:uncharacterized damage-inducible protein DinB
MTIGQSMLPEFDQEMKSTRTVLERVPDEKWNWKPHEKSGTVGWYAWHLSTLPGWATMTINTENLDIAPKDGKGPEMPKADNAKQALAQFDKEVAVEKVSDADLMANWSLLAGGQTILTMPRVAVLRGMVMNHLIHHRGQLTVYFRMLDVPVPALYGPSADEGQMGKPANA